MFCYRKIFLWFVVFTTLFSCKSSPVNGEEGSPQTLNLLFNKEAVFFTLPFSFESKKDSSLEKYSLYSKGDYQTIIKKGFPSKGDDESRYIYIRSLYHLKEWDRLIHSVQAFENSSGLYPYVVFYSIQALTEKKRYHAALEAFDQNRELLNTLPISSEVEEYYHKILAKLKLKDRAIDPGKYFYSLYEEDGDHSALLQAVLDGDRRAIGELTPKNIKKIIPLKYMERAAEVLKTARPSLSVKLYEQLKENQKAGELYFKQQKYGAALSYLKKDSFLASLCRLKLLKADSRDIERARANLEEGFGFLTGYYMDKKNYEEAVNILSIKYQNGFAREMILDLLDKKEYSRLISLLGQLSTAALSVEEKTMTHYWLGTLLILANQQEKAEAVLKPVAYSYPFQYYGWLAYSLLKNKEEAVKNWGNLFEENLKNHKELFEDLKNHSEFPQKARIGLFFLKINENKKGMAELKKHLGENLEPYYVAFVRFFKSIEREDLVIRYATLLSRLINQKAGNSLFYDNLLRELFPLKYKDLITLAAGKYSIQPSLIAGIIRQESNFYDKAVSWVGAKGLMQLMPSTAQPILKKLSRSKASENVSILDPKSNIFSGSIYFNWLYGQIFSSSHEPFRSILSVASYNAGATRIKKLYQSRSDWTPSYFIESIYLTETRDYVKRVLVYKEFYKRLYGI